MLTRGKFMATIQLAAALCALALSALFLPVPAIAEDKEIKIGVLYDLTGPNGDSGGRAAAIGTQLAIDLINRRGGVEGHKIIAVSGDAGSSVETARAEAKRLFYEEGVSMIMGLNTSAQCYALAPEFNARKQLLWLNVCIASNVLKDRHLQYVFRPTNDSDQVGQAACAFLAAHAGDALGFKPNAVRAAIIYEEGVYGSGVARANEQACKKLGVQIVLVESFPNGAKDLTKLIEDMKKARPHVVLHTAYRPEVELFLRQTAELDLNFDALIGQGAGYAQVDALIAKYGDAINHVYNVDTASAQAIDPNSLAQGLGMLTAELVEFYKAETGADDMPSHASQGFNNSWVFLTDVLPRAIKDHGGTEADSLREAALATDIKQGGTIQGFGVKFEGPEAAMAGQNARAVPAIMQYRDGKTEIVWPESLRSSAPVLPFPKGHPYAR